MMAGPQAIGARTVFDFLFQANSCNTNVLQEFAKLGREFKMNHYKLLSGAILFFLIFCLTACSKNDDSNRLTDLNGSVTQQNLVYHIESIEHQKNVKSYDKSLFEQYSEESQKFDEQGNVIQGKTFFVVKVIINNKSENMDSLYVNGIEIYTLDQQLNVDTESRTKMEYFNRPQKNTKEFYKAVIASGTKETYEFGYFVDDAILNDPNLCLVINPRGNQLNDKNVVFITINK